MEYVVVKTEKRTWEQGTETVLDKLPAGTISKRRSSNLHEVTFHLEWGSHMEAMLSEELSDPDRLYHGSTIVTGTAFETQGLTIKQYLRQTWPTIGLQLLEVLGRTSGNLDWPIYSKYLR